MLSQAGQLVHDNAVALTPPVDRWLMRQKWVGRDVTLFTVCYFDGSCHSNVSVKKKGHRTGRETVEGRSGKRRVLE